MVLISVNIGCPQTYMCGKMNHGVKSPWCSFQNQCHKFTRGNCSSRHCKINVLNSIKYYTCLVVFQWLPISLRVKLLCNPTSGPLWSYLILPPTHTPVTLFPQPSLWCYVSTLIIPCRFLPLPLIFSLPREILTSQIGSSFLYTRSFSNIISFLRPSLTDLKL